VNSIAEPDELGALAGQVNGWLITGTILKSSQAVDSIYEVIRLTTAKTEDGTGTDFADRTKLHIYLCCA
jgi:hypothetical protein